MLSKVTSVGATTFGQGGIRLNKLVDSFEPKLDSDG
jgi:hypothetical protein